MKIPGKVSFMCVMLAMVACGKPEGAPSDVKILDGKKFDPYDFSAASIVNIDNSCTGTIISKRHIITAAHCNPQVGATIYYYTQSRRNGQTGKIASVALNTGDLTKLGDLAVIKLASPIPYTQMPMLLPEITDGPLYGSATAGWVAGTGQHDNAINSEKLSLWAGASINPGPAWTGAFVLNAKVTNKGDSGGPFFVQAGNRYKVLGALIGWDSALPGTQVTSASAYTNLYTHLDWIKNEIAK